MKKSLRYSIFAAAFFALMLAFAVAPSTGLAEGTAPTFSVYNGMVYAYEGNLGANPVIPPKINGQSVTSIGASAFADATFETITLPSTVTEIGETAFYACPNLKSITIPSGVKELPFAVFYSCPKLETVNAPGVTKIGDYAFYGNALLANLNAPGVTEIGEGAFYRCSGFTSFSFNNALTSLGAFAFDSCTGLRSVTIPLGLKAIPKNAFSNCANITSVSFRLIVK